MTIPVARKLHIEKRFNLIQHITYVKYWAPSALAFVNGVHFIWGPVGGGEYAPLTFWPSCGLRGICYEALRILAQRLAELDPLVRHTAHQAALCLATTPETASRLKRMGGQKVTIFNQLGLSAAELIFLNELPDRIEHFTRFISVGNLIHLKGFHLGIMAFAQSKLGDTQYWIVGDGPERSRLECLARRLGVADQVRFFGQLPRTKVLELLCRCQALIHPSLHDSGGLVCMEAMAAGRPVICLDLGGPAMQVTNETGFKINAINPSQTVFELAKIMQHLKATPGLWRKMGNNARQRIQKDFSWQHRAENMNDFYNKVDKWQKA